MTVPIWFGALVALLYACAAWLAVQAGSALCAKITPFEDGPRPGRPPTVWLIAGAAAIGGILALQSATMPQLAVGGVLTTALAAAWYCDVRTGIVPDYFTLIPLVVVTLFLHDWWRMLGAVAVTTPFAVAALVSRGRGMGWADVKLASLGAVALGWQQSMTALAVACGAAAAVATVRRRANEPIAFVPYIAGAIAVALAIRVS